MTVKFSVRIRVNTLWPYRLMVRSLDFQSGSLGSNPGRAILFSFNSNKKGDHEEENGKKDIPLCL